MSKKVIYLFWMVKELVLGKIKWCIESDFHWFRKKKWLIVFGQKLDVPIIVIFGRPIPFDW